MEFTNRGRELAFQDPGGRPRLRVGVDETGPGVHLLDIRGGKRASVAFFDNEPAIVLLDENRRKVFEAP